MSNPDVSLLQTQRKNGLIQMYQYAHVQGNDLFEPDANKFINSGCKFLCHPQRNCVLPQQ
jgi:hypothetical protein